ncbi:hypothetical protein ACFLZ7_01105 [Nanoarchaeota archaeon]
MKWGEIGEKVSNLFSRSKSKQEYKSPEPQESIGAEVRPKYNYPSQLPRTTAEMRRTDSRYGERLDSFGKKFLGSLHPGYTYRRHHSVIVKVPGLGKQQLISIPYVEELSDGAKEGTPGLIGVFPGDPSLYDSIIKKIRREIRKGKHIPKYSKDPSVEAFATLAVEDLGVGVRTGAAGKVSRADKISDQLYREGFDESFIEAGIDNPEKSKELGESRRLIIPDANWGRFAQNTSLLELIAFEDGRKTWYEMYERDLSTGGIKKQETDPRKLLREAEPNAKSKLRWEEAIALYLAVRHKSEPARNLLTLADADEEGGITWSAKLGDSIELKLKGVYGLDREVVVQPSIEVPNRDEGSRIEHTHEVKGERPDKESKLKKYRSKAFGWISALTKRKPKQPSEGVPKESTGGATSKPATGSYNPREIISKLRSNKPLMYTGIAIGGTALLGGAGYFVYKNVTENQTAEVADTQDKEAGKQTTVAYVPPTLTKTLVPPTHTPVKSRRNRRRAKPTATPAPTPPQPKGPDNLISVIKENGIKFEQKGNEKRIYIDFKKLDDPDKFSKQEVFIQIKLHDGSHINLDTTLASAGWGNKYRAIFEKVKNGKRKTIKGIKMGKEYGVRVGVKDKKGNLAFSRYGLLKLPKQ